MIYAAPLSGSLRVTRAFGDPRCYVNGQLVPNGSCPPHNGVDLGASCGTPVHAAAAGNVIHASYDTISGNMVKIAHADGSVTWYAHLSAMAVRVGWRVTSGELIGAVGQTGDATGCHLHFGVQTSGGFVDPLPLLGGSVGSGSGTGGAALATSGTLATQVFTALPPSTPLTAALLHMLGGDIPLDNPLRSQMLAGYSAQLGKPINQVPYYTGTFGPPGGGLVSLLPGIISPTGGLDPLLKSDLFGWIPGLLVNLALLAAIVVLADKGLGQILEG